MWKTLLFTPILAVVASGASARESAGPKVRWTHQPGQSLSLAIDGQTLWSYHFAAEDGFPWFHPVQTADGSVLTAFAPSDHPWHRGLWFSWKLIDRVNYWDWATEKSGKPAGRTTRAGKEVVKQGPDSCSISMDLQYSAADKTVLNEKRIITFALPRADGSYTIDWHMTFTAGEGVVLGRTPPEEKPWGGYGGLSFRGAPSMRSQRVLDSEGRQGKEGHGKRARWMDFSAQLDQHGTAAGVAIFDHPGNPRHPSPWYVSLGKMPYFNPAFLFAEPYTLPAGKPLVLRYRVLIHPGQGEPDRLEKEFEAFKRL